MLLLLMAFRLYLTGNRDILALNAPHDEFWYVDTAFNHIWRGSYSEMKLIHLPTYAVWLMGVDLLGIPARLAIDLAWLVACGYLAYALRRLTQVTWTAVALFIFLTFHPYIIRIFDRALAETLLTVLSTAVLAAGMELWNRRQEGPSAARRCAMVVYGVGFGTAYHTRSEGAVLLVPLGLLALWSLVDRWNWWLQASRHSLLIPLLGLPLLATVLLGLGFSAANYAKWGIWASQELDAPGYKSAMTALNSIDTGPTPKQITVTQEMLGLGFQASPTLRELQPAMTGATGQQWVAIASPYVSVKGEIANGWFYWALRDVAARSGWHASAALAERKYAAVAAELQQAFADGRLKKRFVLSSFIDPDIKKWAPDLPASLRRILLLIIRPAAENLETPTENASPAQFSQYVAVTGRRGPALAATVGGWVVAPAGSQVGLDAEGGAILWQKLMAPRSDVPGAYGFLVSAQGLKVPTALHLQTSDGTDLSVMLSSLQAGRVTELTPTGSYAGLRVGVDRLEVTELRQRGERFLKRIGEWYVGWHYLLFATSVIGSAIWLVRRNQSAESMVFILLVAAILARVGLFAILDASSWSGSQPRYMLPIFPLAGVAGFLGLIGLSRLLARMLRR
ncbi:hypothetical protein [Rhodoferax sp. OV413]|uniref:hypothetical protein n=1 Tax=Rhodoferax sp. OV413 TaxID=1855285 RepID=UPI00115FA398|nr:hypothetical protein [Rhodoferax sp. OV413]